MIPLILRLPVDTELEVDITDSGDEADGAKTGDNGIAFTLYWLL